MEDLPDTVNTRDLRKHQPRFSGLESGHRACLGCGEALGARLVTEAAGPDVMYANATGCLEVFTTAWPESAWRVAWMHSLFENAAAVAAGMEAALKRQGKATRVIAMGGDGGTFDIGFQALSGMLERGHNVLYVCFDNEAYMNTGIQRSGSTPHAAATTTSPSGKMRMGKRHLKKDIVSIVAAHHIPYAHPSCGCRTGRPPRLLRRRGYGVPRQSRQCLSSGAVYPCASCRRARSWWRPRAA